VGSSGGVWSSPSNWSSISGGAGGFSSPTLINDVIFDNAFSGFVEMDVLNPSAFLINSIRITGNTNVTLRRTQNGGGSRILRLVSISSTTKGLQIDNGSTLVIDANNTGGGLLNFDLALTGGAGVTGEISGNLHFTGTGTNGSCDAALDLFDGATFYAALVVKNLGAIKYFTNTGNTGPSTGSYLTMENGSVYELEKNGGSFPPGNWEPNSLAKVFNASGTNGPTFNGNAYGNLEWNCPAMTFSSFLNANFSFNNINLLSTNNTAIRVKTGVSPGINTLTIYGDLTISSSSRLETTGNTALSGNGGIINLKGNLINQGLLTTTGITGTINQFEINGNINQNISNFGTFSGNIVFIQNNPAGSTLLTPLILPYNLILDTGKIKTNAFNILIMVDNAVVTGGAINSFVEGPMKKGGDDASFTFPVGKGLMYSPISFNAPGGSLTDTFFAEYLRSNPQNAFGINYDPVGNPEIIDHISYVEYMKLKKTNGTISTLSVTLTASFFTFSTNLNTTFIAKLTQPGSMWKNCGTAVRNTTGFIGAYETGTIQTPNTLIIDDSIFTFSTDQLTVVNPLPILLQSFNAIKINSTCASIDWSLTECCSNDARFEIQKSRDSRTFTPLITVPGNETSRFYNYNDTRLEKGITYYRLKMTDADGKISYSKLVAVINESEGLLITSLSPNPVMNEVFLNISSAKSGSIKLAIYDLSGRITSQWTDNVREGSNSVRFNTNKIAGGIYLLAVQLDDNRSVIRFVKQ